MVKSKWTLLVLLSVFFFSGCASKIDAVPVEKKDNVLCDSCGENESVDAVCAKEVKVVRYKDACNHGCEFPVTVRAKSSCKYGGGM